LGGSGLSPSRSSTQAISGAVLLAAGSVWTFQGIGALKGSFMTGEPVWLWIGLACIVTGAGMLFLGFRKPHR